MCPRQLETKTLVILNIERERERERERIREKEPAEVEEANWCEKEINSTPVTLGRQVNKLAHSLALALTLGK